MMTSRTLVFLSMMLYLMQPLRAIEPSAGLWYSPAFDGHGFDLQRAGEVYVVVFYSYDSRTEPIWYLSVASESDGVLSGEFGLYSYDSDRSPPQQLVREPGSFSIDTVSTGQGSVCENDTSEERAVFSWNLDDESGQWCVRPLLQQSTRLQTDLTGLWYAGEGDPGWGLSLDYQGEDEDRTEVAVLFHYDSEGMPRWSIGVTEQGGADATVPMLNLTGYCPSCPVVETSPVDAGSITHQIAIEDDQASGTVELDIDYAFNPGGQWQRQASPLITLSDPLPGLTPLPETITADQKTAFINATVIPMTDGLPVLEMHGVLVENGLITAIAPMSQLEIPADAEIINARGLYLAPGMTEMHLHITFGGQAASEEAGLMMIANGITTALNMGNSFSFNVPFLGTRFESGQLIGPSLYAGQVAYGPADGASSSLTVSSPAGATTYAQTLHDVGYDFIKTYWQLTPQVFAQFQVESERLGLPIIGHIPQRLPMNHSLSGGHRMAAHIQEPHVTFMNFDRNDSLFKAAADVFLENGTYMTPTLAVFESFVMVSGNRRDNYDALVAREGQQYQPSSIKNAWENYFNSTVIQNLDPVSQDDLLAFYGRMTKYFHEAGVPLLTGTDAPGFPGLMSGFGVHEELRLFSELGIPAQDIFATTTRNAGLFVDDTLAPVHGFGLLEVGRRADMIMTVKNPLTSIEHLKRPAGVMSRGRFWSQDFLQQELDKLRIRIKNRITDDSRYQNTEIVNICPHH